MHEENMLSKLSVLYKNDPQRRKRLNTGHIETKSVFLKQWAYRQVQMFTETWIDVWSSQFRPIFVLILQIYNNMCYHLSVVNCMSGKGYTETKKS